MGSEGFYHQDERDLAAGIGAAVLIVATALLALIAILFIISEA